VNELGQSRDAVLVQRSGSFFEKGNWQARWILEKYADDEAFARGEPYSRTVLPGNILLNDGIGELLDLLIGAGGTAFNNANARIGVGDGDDDEAPTQTGLVGTNKTYKGMDLGFPSRSDQTVSFRATFGGAEANYAWREFTVDNGTISLNRKVSDQGTKASGQTWTITLEITIA